MNRSRSDLRRDEKSSALVKTDVMFLVNALFYRWHFTISLRTSEMVIRKSSPRASCSNPWSEARMVHEF